MAHALGVKNAALTFSGDIIEMKRSKDLRALRELPDGTENI